MAGNQSGTVKLWDLEQAKVIRTLLGHRAPCISVEFHPYGDFFASGSLDTNLKIWDIRRKSCIQTYKGHSQGVTGVSMPLVVCVFHLHLCVLLFFFSSSLQLPTSLCFAFRCISVDAASGSNPAAQSSSSPPMGGG